MINSLSKLIYMHVYVQRFVLTNILASQLGPLKPKFLAPPLGIHMDSILLDEHDVPKLSNFLASTLIPEGETDVETNGNVWYSRFKTPEIKATGKAT